MGLFGDKRPLPHYFVKDQVGGLSHLLRITVKQDALDQYRDLVFNAYDQDYALSCVMGLLILMEPDKKKYGTLDTFVAEYYPDMPPRTSERDQGLLSLLIYRAMVPFYPRKALQFANTWRPKPSPSRAVRRGHLFSGRTDG